jgi:hypothetical protein
MCSFIIMAAWWLNRDDDDDDDVVTIGVDSGLPDDVTPCDDRSMEPVEASPAA